METSAKVSITVETTVNAAIEKVWECWNKPEHITKWNAASDDWHTPKAEVDFRVGGKSSATMAAKDGTMSFDFWYVYDKIIPFEILESTMGDGRKMSVQFIKTDAGIKMIETFEAETQNAVEMQKAGWQAILNNFKKYVEAK